MENKEVGVIGDDKNKEIIASIKKVSDDITKNEDEKKIEEMKSVFEKKNGVTMEEFIETLAPRPRCRHCYGRGYVGWKAPIINWKDMPKGMQQKKPARERHTMKGEKVTCRCIINQYINALKSIHEDWNH